MNMKKKEKDRVGKASVGEDATSSFLPRSLTQGANRCQGQNGVKPGRIAKKL